MIKRIIMVIVTITTITGCELDNGPTYPSNPCITVSTKDTLAGGWIITASSSNQTDKRPCDNK